MPRQKTYPAEPLRARLVENLGLHRDEHEYLKLRTLLYQRGLPPPQGSDADELAELLLNLKTH